MTLDLETYAVLVPSFAWLDMALAHTAQTEARREQKRVWAANNRATKRQLNAPCAGCGRAFENRRKGWIRKFCTDLCRARHHDRLRKAAMRKEAAHCVCGVTLVQDPKSKPRKWCSEKCRRKHRREAA